MRLSLNFMSVLLLLAPCFPAGLQVLKKIPQAPKQAALLASRYADKARGSGCTLESVFEAAQPNLAVIPRPIRGSALHACEARTHRKGSN